MSDACRMENMRFIVMRLKINVKVKAPVMYVSAAVLHGTVLLYMHGQQYIPHYQLQRLVPVTILLH